MADGCNGGFFSQRKPIADFVYETYVATGEVEASILVEAGYLNRADAEKVSETFKDGKYNLADSGDFHRIGGGAYYRDWLGRWVRRKDFESLTALENRPVQTRIENLVKIISDQTKSPDEVESAMNGLLAIPQFSDQISSNILHNAFFAGLCRYPALYTVARDVFSKIKDNENLNLILVEQLEKLAQQKDFSFEVRMNAAKILYQLYNRGSYLISIFLDPQTDEEAKRSILDFFVSSDQRYQIGSLDAFGPMYYRGMFPKLFDTLFDRFESIPDVAGPADYTNSSYTSGVALLELATPQDARQYSHRLVKIISETKDNKCKVELALGILIEMQAREALPALRKIKSQISKDDRSEVGCHYLEMDDKKVVIDWAILELEKF